MLQVGDDLKQIARLRIAARAEHAHQAFRGAVGCIAQFSKADGGVDEIAKNDLAGFHVTGKKVFNALAEKRFAEARIAFDAGADGFLEIACQSQCLFLFFLLPFSQRVVFPAVERQVNIALLAFFRAAAEEDHERVAVLAEVKAVARTKVDTVFVNASANALGVGEIALLDACQSSCHLCGRFSVQTVRPVRERTATCAVEIFAHFDYN